ncbi:hypothetical protein CRG98_037052 [Punica granatum]|uniref:Uncharacterized protein n=1 Tax=Punica granatum TaxID=22663 RepID=A0A2I0IEV3_PUNGR|nr:hypothetical protein CRG98_037052 [Punica granatum]
MESSSSGGGATAAIHEGARSCKKQLGRAEMEERLAAVQERRLEPAAGGLTERRRGRRS